LDNPVPGSPFGARFVHGNTTALAVAAARSRPKPTPIIVTPGRPTDANDAGRPVIVTTCHLIVPPRHGTLELLSQKCLEPDRGPDGTRSAIFVIGDSSAGEMFDKLQGRFGENLSVRSFRASGDWCCDSCWLESCYSQRLTGRVGRDWIAETQERMRGRCEDVAQVVLRSLRGFLRPDDILVMSNRGHLTWRAAEMSALKGRIVGPDTSIIRRATLAAVYPSPETTLVVVGPPRLPRSKRSECASTDDQPHAAGQCDWPGTGLTRQLMGDLFDFLE
jgi:hypothetical protein